jgi:hypothetical protein
VHLGRSQFGRPLPAWAPLAAHAGLTCRLSSQPLLAQSAAAIGALPQRALPLTSRAPREGRCSAASASVGGALVEFRRITAERTDARSWQQRRG